MFTLLLTTYIAYATFQDQNQYEQFDYITNPLRNNKLVELTMIGQYPLTKNLVANARFQISEDLETPNIRLNVSAGVSLYW